MPPALRRALAALVLCALAARATAAEPAAPRTRNVVLVTIDGLRCEEVFGPSREALLPFVWTVMARQGQVLGDEARGSRVRVTNGPLKSYPGYSELLTGVADPRIRGNDPIVNPNPNVLEWLDAQPDLRGHVAAFGSWGMLPLILGGERSRLAVDAPDRHREDARTEAAALDGVRSRAPRVLYVMLGATDHWAHDGRRELYLQAAREADAFLSRLWALLQELPAYRDRTTLVVTTDHGRGHGEDWTRHGAKVPGSDRVWVAVLGPDTPALGDRSGVEATQSQVAATVAALLGRDYRSAVPSAAPPLAGVSGAAPR